MQESWFLLRARWPPISEAFNWASQLFLLPFRLLSFAQELIQISARKIAASQNDARNFSRVANIVRRICIEEHQSAILPLSTVPKSAVRPKNRAGLIVAVCNASSA